MNLRWNGSLRRFEAEFSDFSGDLTAVKAAGFKTTGAPQWVWYSVKAAPLTKLRENRPASGLTITPDAREQYTALLKVDESNAPVKAALEAHKKTLKKRAKIVEQEKNAVVIPEKGYIDASDLPPQPTHVKLYTPPPPPDTRCIICGDPVYFYEQLNPPACLWCSKICLDNVSEVC
jgi:hypothetical protein